jgi:homoserine kinase
VRITVRVPATSANLGPGFDCFGLALDLCNEVTVDTEAEPGVSWEGEGADELPTDGTDMVSRAIAYTAERLASRYPDSRIPIFALHGVNRIPLASGLGSSAAATVAGVMVARTFLGDHPRPGAEPGATLVHDNVAAATVGGFVIVVTGHVHRFDPHPNVDPVVLLPRHLRMSTHEARGVVPEAVPRWQAISNLSSASVLALALVTEPERIWLGLQDWIHQSARIALMPEVASLAERLEEDAVPFCLSGAGPSLLVFEREGATVPEDLGDGWEVLRPGVSLTGADVAVER